MSVRSAHIGSNGYKPKNKNKKKKKRERKNVLFEAKIKKEKKRAHTHSISIEYAQKHTHALRSHIDRSKEKTIALFRTISLVPSDLSLILSLLYILLAIRNGKRTNRFAAIWRDRQPIVAAIRWEHFYF